MDENDKKTSELKDLIYRFTPDIGRFDIYLSGEDKNNNFFDIDIDLFSPEYGYITNVGASSNSWRPLEISQLELNSFELKELLDNLKEATRDFYQTHINMIVNAFQEKVHQIEAQEV